MNDIATQLHEKLETRNATIGIIGLGYVGLPLAQAAHKAGYKVLGFDTDTQKVEKLNSGETYLQHLGNDLVKTLHSSDRFTATDTPDELGDADAILLCVPTPLGAHREPDLSYVTASTELVAKILRPGQLIVLESTTYPGTTRQDMCPILERGDLVVGRDFFVAYSPEREDPGRAGTTTSTIPKLVGGTDVTSGKLAATMYRQMIDTVHLVSTAEIAEAAKLLENIYRAVNIAMVNELKTVLSDMDIDIWEVIEAAATKPFGFQAFYPGPGLGGHCIPIDPFYLTWKAKEVGHTTRFIELAGEVNAQMPSYVVSRIAEALNHHSLSIRGSRILLLGIAYKKNVDDIRESPAAEIIDLLNGSGAHVVYHDPHVTDFPEMRHHNINMTSMPLTEEEISKADAVVIVTDHDQVDYDLVGQNAKLIVDTRNAMERVENPSSLIVKS
ncbi:MAG: nucleotide sugar dehydrogenase [Phycisphaerales bacterium]|nr:nucleotide sugar dehydrogenase [Phycisphaerales bacterium]